MPLMTPEDFEESLKSMRPRVYMNGKRIDNILENPNTRTVVESNKASYGWALDPKSKDVMSCYSPLIDDRVNRYTHVSTDIEDLVKKAEAGTFTAERLGTCIYRCVGYDAFHYPPHFLFRLAHRQAAQGIAIEADIQQTGERRIPQRLVHTALHNAE